MTPPMKQARKLARKFPDYLIGGIKGELTKIDESNTGRIRSFTMWAVFWAGLSVGVLTFFRIWHPFEDTIDRDIHVWEVFFSVFGLTYAVLVGLLIVESHRRWRDLSSIVQGEHNAINDIYDFLRYFVKDSVNRGPSQQVMEATLDYVNGEFESKWWKKGMPRSENTADYQKRVHAIIDAVDTIKVQDGNDQCALEAIMGRIPQITACRVERIEIFRQGLHRVFYYILTGMSLVLVTGICTLGVKSLWLHLPLVLVTTVALYALYMLVKDLDHPTHGFWNIGEEFGRRTKDMIIRIESDIVEIQGRA